MTAREYLLQGRDARASQRRCDVGRWPQREMPRWWHLGLGDECGRGVNPATIVMVLFHCFVVVSCDLRRERRAMKIKI